LIHICTLEEQAPGDGPGEEAPGDAPGNEPVGAGGPVGLQEGEEEDEDTEGDDDQPMNVDDTDTSDDDDEVDNAGNNVRTPRPLSHIGMSIFIKLQQL
jgi:hypothetical protein